MAEVFLAFLRLGCISFGGPVAHLAMFRAEFVQKRRWPDDDLFSQCIAITQVLSGPDSSQTAMLIGYLRAGWRGTLAAWIAFTLPSAILMTAFALSAGLWSTKSGWVRGVLTAAAGIVAQVVLSMTRTLVLSTLQCVLLFATFGAILVSPFPRTGPIAVLASAVSAALVMRTVAVPRTGLDLGISRRAGVVAAALFVMLLAALTLSARSGEKHVVLAAATFQTGSLVFGGGHVIGLLAAAFVTPVWTNAVRDRREGVLAAAAFAALVWWKRPAWQVVGACAPAGAALLR